MTAATSLGLSVCCLTSGRHPERLASILTLFAPVADEVVVAVEEPRVLETHAALGGVADVVLSFPPTHPSDRPIPWLFGSCRGRWIFNVDDDEVPSAALLEMLPAVAARDDITHAWVARRWLYPTTATYLAEAPWNTEFQLRLLLADPRFTQFSDVFHRPVIAHGPGLYLDGVLWHLDNAITSVARRRSKAEAYELERPGMRISGRSHNHALYVPELAPEPRLAPVPRDELDVVERVIAGGGGLVRHDPPRLLYASAEDVDAAWPGASDRLATLRGQIWAPAPPAAMRERVQETVDVSITNESNVTWRWGKDARPAVWLAYSWRRDGEPVHEPTALRTVLPADLEPGATQLVPMHVVPPAGAGRYELRLELVHEGIGMFAMTPPLALTVEARERVALVGRAAGDHAAARAAVRGALRRAGDRAGKRQRPPRLRRLRLRLAGSGGRCSPISRRPDCSRGRSASPGARCASCGARAATGGAARVARRRSTRSSSSCVTHAASSSPGSTGRRTRRRAVSGGDW